MPDYPATRPQLAFDYLGGLVRWLASSDYSVMTYRDLAMPLTVDNEPEEFRTWIASNTHSRAVLLHYDVDANPAVTHRLLEIHLAHRVPANVMVFRRKIFDWRLKRHGVVEFDEDYQLDFRQLTSFQAMGGVVGYHCNAFDQAGGNEALALEIFRDDVRALREHLDLRFISMHGGHVTPDGRCNATLPIQALLQELGLSWVHNGHSAYFHANWADGSASNPVYRNEASDPLDFLLSTNPGQRTRLLFHPQYYNDHENRVFDFPILEKMRWVASTRRTVERGRFDGKAYWAAREREAREEISKLDKLFAAQDDERPVFVSGLSRSGTTLLVSILDAHPEGAMAYESYPRYLHVPSDDGVLAMESFLYAYQCLMNYEDQEAFRLLGRAPLRNLGRFAAVSNWTGMNLEQIGRLLRAYLVKHHRIHNARDALAVVAATARHKQQAEQGSFWGSKCQGNYDDYFALWPGARLVYIIRHGLDILASQKTTGAFNPDPHKLGRQWRQHLDHFDTFCSRNPSARATRVHYESLVTEPEATCRRLCDEIGLRYHPQMIRQHEVENTLVKEPRGQLSAARIQQPIDRSAIDRWRQDLSPDDIAAFLDGCGGPSTFIERGYEWQD